jgi:methylenetetrahydrofolate dehydrogenase (NADP+)/methenyltetrahydrofolate cyclohydrolase
MTAIILDGKKTRDEAIPALIKRVKGFSFVPVMTIIQVGERADTASYIRSKKTFADKIGVEVRHIQVPEITTQTELIDIVKKNNEDSSVNSIIVQLPLPANIDRDSVIDTILPSKDVDALTAFNVKQWSDGQFGAILPATARGVHTLLKKYNISLNGKKAVVVGRSALVGKPIAAMCIGEKAIVTVCHSKTPDLAKETLNADIIIVATGKPGLISAEHVKAGQVIVDVGINSVAGKLVGDVDFDGVVEKVAFITPVPGGVGPMTVLSLFENLLDLCE